MICPSFGFGEECNEEDCGLDFSDCDYKYFPELFGQECRLTIDSLNPETDFGNWQCQIFADDESVKSDIKIIESKPAKIVFEDIYGEIEINLGKKISVLTLKLCNNFVTILYFVLIESSTECDFF